MKQPPGGDLFDQLPDARERERIEPLVEGAGFRLERIVSRGQASPEGFWYDQPEDEWVAGQLLQLATLGFDTAPRLEQQGNGHHRDYAENRQKHGGGSHGAAVLRAC